MSTGQDSPTLDKIKALAMHTHAAAHELKNLLTHLLLYSGLIAGKVEDAETRELIDSLEKSVHLGVDAARNLMLIAQETRREVPVDLRLLLGEIQILAEERFPRDVVLATDYTEELWPVSARLVELYDAVGRLCDSAREALPDAGTVLLQAQNLEPGRSQVEPRVEDSGRFVALTVTAVAANVDSEAVERLLSREPLAEALDPADHLSLDQLAPGVPPGTSDGSGVAVWRLHLPVWEAAG